MVMKYVHIIKHILLSFDSMIATLSNLDPLFYWDLSLFHLLSLSYFSFSVSVHIEQLEKEVMKRVQELTSLAEFRANYDQIS